jgi:hypothetical protein
MINCHTSGDMNTTNEAIKGPNTPSPVANRNRKYFLYYTVHSPLLLGLNLYTLRHLLILHFAIQWDNHHHRDEEFLKRATGAGTYFQFLCEHILIIRVKKGKCDGKKPVCTRCALDGQMCMFSERKFSKDRVIPKGYCSMLAKLTL